MSATHKIEGEQTPLPPLVSDERLRKIAMGLSDEHGIRTNRKLQHLYNAGYVAANDMRRIYEQDRQRTREVVQALVNCIRIADTYGQFRPMGPYRFDPESKYHERQQDEITAIALAKSINIEPSRP